MAESFAMEGLETQRLLSSSSSSDDGASDEDASLDKALDPVGPGDLQLEEDSPYAEVRSAVANTDDPGMPVGTLRAWIIGLLWAILIPGLNQ